MLRQSFIVGITNPNTIVFFVAVLPHSVNFTAGAILFQLMVLGLMFVAIGFVSDTIWAILEGTAQAWFAKSPSRLTGICTVGGSLMIGLGGSLAFVSNRTYARLPNH